MYGTLQCCDSIFHNDIIVMLCAHSLVDSCIQIHVRVYKHGCDVLHSRTFLGDILKK